MEPQRLFGGLYPSDFKMQDSEFGHSFQLKAIHRKENDEAL